MSTSDQRWRPIRLLLSGLIVGGLLWGGWSFWALHRARRILVEAKREMQAGRARHAARKLVALLGWQHRSDEVAYLLGNCEQSMGRTEAAVKAWARVPPESPFALRALRGRMELTIAGGHLSDGELLITDAMNDQRIDRFGLPLVLAVLYSQQGRFEDALRLVEESWDRLDRGGDGASERAIQTLDMHIRLRLEPLSVDEVGPFLDRAAMLAPDDDRVWLARANLAIRTGSDNKDVARWIDDCLRRRPEDVPVWRAKLNWAVATNRIEEARLAAPHIPAEMATRAEVQRLAAWYSALRGDVEGERQALDRLLTVDPADFRAMDSLAQLAAKHGRPERAADLTRRKNEFQQLQARYRALHQRNQPVRDAVKLACLAEQLGQWFEAKAFLTLAVDADPERDDLRTDLNRLNQAVKTMTSPGWTFIDVLDHRLPEKEPSV